MPSDYGDDSGERLVDWMLRIGQEAGEAAMAASAERLADALRNARGRVAEEAESEPEGARREAQWAKLNMHEFEELPEFESIKELIGERLNGVSVEHAFHNDGKAEFLVFKVEDAPEIDEVFGSLEKDAANAMEKAKEALGPARTRDAERLSVKAEQARAASAASRAAREQVRQVERMEQRAR